MYDPEGSDNNKEYIELYDEASLDLSAFTAGDSSSNDSLALLNLANSTFCLIAEEGFNFTGLNVTVYSVGSAIGNGLNKEDSIYIYANGTLLANLSYHDPCEEGYSIEYFNSTYACSLYQGGTPGKRNSREFDYPKGIKINEFLPNPQGDDKEPAPDGEFVELCSITQASLRGYYLEDLSGRAVYIADTSSSPSTNVNDSCIAVFTNSYFLNNEGYEEISLYDPFGNLIDTVSYASSEESLSWSLFGDTWRYAFPTPAKGNERKEIGPQSAMKIISIDDLDSNGEAQFGDLIRVNFFVYKANTTKSSVKLYIETDKERISKVAKVDLPNKYTNYSLTLPLQIFQNCKAKYEGGDYYVKLAWTSSSNQEDAYKIKLNGINPDACEESAEEKTVRSGKVSYKLIDFPRSIEPENEFSIKLELANNDDIDHYIDVYSYIYRGSKCYSIGRQANKKTIFVKQGELAVAELTDKVISAEPGEYNLKVRLKRDDQKTEKEITEVLEILPQTLTQTTGLKAVKKEVITNQEMQGIVIPLLILMREQTMSW